MLHQDRSTGAARHRWGCAGALLLVLLVLSACASGASSAAKAPTATPTVTPLPLGAPNCQPPSPITLSAIPEVRGTVASGTGEMWGLLMGGGGPPVHAQEDIKIVWRMTGSGDFQIVAQGPAGARAPLLFGPDKHISSSWRRPGDEWGTGFHFPVAGCWDLHAARDSLSGDVWLLVVVH